MSATGLVVWALVIWFAYQVKLALQSEAGKKLLDAVVERIKRPKPEESDG